VGDREEGKDLGHTLDGRKEVFYLYMLCLPVRTLYCDDLGSD
jgi:hypothetical protein